MEPFLTSISFEICHYLTKLCIFFFLEIAIVSTFCWNQKFSDVFLPMTVYRVEINDTFFRGSLLERVSLWPQEK